jgi:hypothetical protein
MGGDADRHGSVSTSSPRPLLPPWAVLPPAVCAAPPEEAPALFWRTPTTGALLLPQAESAFKPSTRDNAPRRFLVCILTHTPGAAGPAERPLNRVCHVPFSVPDLSASRSAAFTNSHAAESSSFVQQHKFRPRQRSLAKGMTAAARACEERPRPRRCALRVRRAYSESFTSLQRVGSPEARLSVITYAR